MVSTDAASTRALRAGLAICLSLLIGGFAGCGGTQNSAIVPPTIEPPSGELLVQQDGYTLREVAGDSYGIEPNYSLVIAERDGGTDVTVRADASDLRQSLLTLEYPEGLQPAEGRAVAWPGQGELITLIKLDQPDAVHFGAVIPRPQESIGASGGFDILRLRFEHSAEPRSASSPPLHERSMIPDFTADAATGQLTFSYYNNGDYDQNTEVNIADLTPLGVHFLKSGGPFDPATVESVVDGDGNGEINLADITPIGSNFRNSIASWALYAGAEADYPDSPIADNGEAELLASVLSDELSNDAATARRTVDTTLDELIGSTAEAVWLRPVSVAPETGGEGIASNMVLLGGGGADTEPPVWTDDANPGVQAVAPHDGAATVYWGEATDTMSSPVGYTVYYSEGTTVDFGSALALEVPASDPFDSFEFTELTGLTNGTEYAVAVRAKDSATTPNEEQNDIVVTVTPQSPVDLPADISADMTFSTPMIIGDGDTSTLTNSPMLTFNGDLIIDGTLLGLNGDICIIVEGDLFVSGSITLDGPDDPLPDDSEWNNIKIVCKGNYFFEDTSVVGGEANIYIVDDEADLVSTQNVIDDTDTDQNPGDYPFNFMPDDGSETSSIRVTEGSSQRTASSTAAGPFPCRGWVRGNWGQIPTPPKGVKRVVLNIRARNGRITFQDFEVTGPKGRKGDDDMGCTAVGGKGEDAFRCRIHAADRVTFQDVTINLGDGGDGGDATAGPCCDADATGGNGGQDGKFRFTAGNAINILGSMNLNPGKGGNGGSATATGQDGTSGCPCTDGCNATAIGGNGASTMFGIRIRGNVGGVSSINIGPSRGGDGGPATAIGGLGGSNSCCPGGMGCAGGMATATGGNGGAATFGALAGANGGGATGGNGGDATATGGKGGDGASCSKFEEGGAGGPGGDATATSGTGGAASGNGPLTVGMDGTANATGGDGGNGGDGCNAGGGGPGGTAMITGVGTANDGDPGAGGTTHCPLYLCIPFPSLVPGDPLLPHKITDGIDTHSGMAPLLDMDTMDPVGQVPFTWRDTSPEPNQDIVWAPDNVPPVVCLINQTGSGELNFNLDLDNIEWFGEPLPLVGSEIGVNFGQSFSTGGEIGHQGAIDIELMALQLQSIAPHPPGPISSPQEFFVDSFFDVFYEINIEPEATCFIEWIYLIDP